MSIFVWTSSSCFLPLPLVRFASTHSPFTRTHSNHKLQPNTRNTHVILQRAHSTAQPDTSLNQTSVFTNYPQLSLCPDGGTPTMALPTVTSTLREDVMLEQWRALRNKTACKITILKGLMALILVSVFAIHLSLQTGFAVHLLWQSSQVCGLYSGSRGITAVPCFQSGVMSETRTLLRGRCNFQFKICI